MLRKINYLLVLISFAIFVSCSGEEEGNGSVDQSDSYSVSLDFERQISSSPNPFKVIITVKKNGVLLSGQSANLVIQLQRGLQGAVSEPTTGKYEFIVTPTQTGEHKVTVSLNDVSVERTPLVMQAVHADWGQPQAVPGYPNTAGYEDGVTITPDGEYLFVQTGPYRWSGLMVFNESRSNGGCGGHRLSPSRCNHDWIDYTIGTYTDPERPDFFDGRFSGTTILHNANSWGVGTEGTPNFPLGTMFYGFKRQNDGSYKQPFYMAFDDLGDAIIGPFGLSFRKNNNGTHTIIFTLKDSFTTDGGFDVYTRTATLGSHINLGDYELSSPSNPPNRGSYFPSTLVDLGENSGTQGNPYLYYAEDGTIKSIWTDDEYDGSGDSDYHKLSVYTLESGTFPSAGSWEKTTLPAPIDRGSEAIQPTFVGDGLYFTEDTNIAYSTYSGSDTSTDYSNGSNWSTPIHILSKDTGIAATCTSSCDADIGKIVAIGEPTIATIDSETYLYFVYAYIREYDQSATGWFDLDFQAGFIKKH